MPSARLKTGFRGYGPGRVDMPDSVYMAAARAGLVLRSGDEPENAPQSPAIPSAIDWESAGLTKDQRQALTDAGLDDSELLQAAEDSDILALPHIGPAALKRIRAALEE